MASSQSFSEAGTKRPGSPLDAPIRKAASRPCSSKGTPCSAGINDRPLDVPNSFHPTMIAPWSDVSQSHGVLQSFGPLDHFSTLTQPPPFSSHATPLDRELVHSTNADTQGCQAPWQQHGSESISQASLPSLSLIPDPVVTSDGSYGSPVASAAATASTVPLPAEHAAQPWHHASQFPSLGAGESSAAPPFPGQDPLHALSVFHHPPEAHLAGTGPALPHASSPLQHSSSHPPSGSSALVAHDFPVYSAVSDAIPSPHVTTQHQSYYHPFARDDLALQFPLLTQYPVPTTCFGSGPAASPIPSSLTPPAAGSQSAPLVSSEFHRLPFGIMSGQQHPTNSGDGYVNVVVAPSDNSANTQSILENHSDIEETVAVGERPESGPEGVDPRRDGFAGPLSQRGSAVDLSFSQPSSSGSSPSQSRTRKSSFVNLCVRDGVLYNDTKCIDIGEIDTHSYEEMSVRKQRGRFTDDQRRETGETRKMRACFRCHSQRIRCFPNPDSPNDPKAPCDTCLQVSQTKKVIHHFPCVRFNATSIVLYRSGGLNLTARWNGTQVKDVGDWADKDILEVQMGQGLSRTPITLKVRKFKPKPGDVLCRRWIDKDGPTKQDLPPFALADIRKTAAAFKAYLETNALDGLVEVAKGSDEIIRRTYEELVAHCRSLPDETVDPVTQERRQNTEKRLVLDLIYLAFAMRHMTGSSWLCGNETLGIEPSNNESNPIRGRRSIPRMIVAQFDSIQCEIILKKVTPAVLKQLLVFTSSNNPSNWFTLYLITFVLLHEISFSTHDRRRHAYQNSAKMQEGANVLLGVWQYYKCVDLVKFDWGARTGSRLRHLSPGQAEFIRWSVETLIKEDPSIPKTPDEGCWEHPLYFVSHMYKAWSPLPTYNYSDQ